jgi:Phage protein Gp19/Gp15/Gp42
VSVGAPLATVEDVEAVWRPLDADERSQADRLLVMASGLARQAVPTVDARVAASTAFADVTSAVVASAVVRVLVNPDGWTQRAEGPFSATFASGSGRLYLSEEELALLRPPVTSLAGVYSVGLGGAP